MWSVVLGEEVAASPPHVMRPGRKTRARGLGRRGRSGSATRALCGPARAALGRNPGWRRRRLARTSLIGRGLDDGDVRCGSRWSGAHRGGTGRRRRRSRFRHRGDLRRTRRACAGGCGGRRRRLRPRCSGPLIVRERARGSRRRSFDRLRRRRPAGREAMIVRSGRHHHHRSRRDGISGDELKRFARGRQPGKRFVIDAEGGKHAESAAQRDDRRNHRRDHQADIGEHSTSQNARARSEDIRVTIGDQIIARAGGLRASRDLGRRILKPRPLSGRRFQRTQH